MLKRSKVLVLDEATANVDLDTDRLIQNTLRSRDEGPAGTVLTIAHRLNTIAECDRVAVMAEGKVAEVGPPRELLSGPPGSLFKQMWEASTHASEGEAAAGAPA